MSSANLKLRRIDAGYSLYNRSARFSNNDDPSPAREEEEKEEDGAIISEDKIHHGQSNNNKVASLLLMSLAALGTVYGDLGTSPFYTLNAVLSYQLGNPTSPSIPSRSDVIGALSNIIWALFLVPVIKYSWIVLQADYQGEGGTFSIYLLLMRQREKMKVWAVRLLLCLSLAAASLLVADTTITPAITILGALEGIELVLPNFKHYTVPSSILVVIVLFFFQYKGTGVLGLCFGPILVIWFVSIGSIGGYNIFTYDTSVLEAFNPWKAIDWWLTGSYTGYPAFAAMGSVMLSVTGAETMYADMGHFGRPAVLTAFYCPVLPALFLQYCGQGSYMLYLIQNQENLNYTDDQVIALMNMPFWSAVPQNGLYYFMLVIATLASIIASESVIIGCFTLVNQASHLQFIPNIPIVHTNSNFKGQVYVPSINWILCVIVVLLIVIYRTSSNLTSLYGTAIATLFILTSILIFLFVAPICWRWPWIVCIALFIIFGGYDAILWISTLIEKVPDGGWVPLVMAAFVCLFMAVWILGKRRSREGYLKEEAAERKVLSRFLPRLKSEAEEEEEDKPCFSKRSSWSRRTVASAVAAWEAVPLRAIEASLSEGGMKNERKARYPIVKSISSPAVLSPDKESRGTTKSSGRLAAPCVKENDLENGEAETTDVPTNLDPHHLIVRSPGLGVFMTEDVEVLPIAMIRIISRLAVLPEYAMLCTVHISEDPFVSLRDRVELRCLDSGYKVYQAEIFFGWAESVSELKTCEFLRDYAVYEASQNSRKASKDSINNTVPNEEKRCCDELVNLLSNLVMHESNASASFRHKSDLPIAFFVDSTRFKAMNRNLFSFSRALMYAFYIEKKLFNTDPASHYNLPIDNTFAVGTVVYC